MSYTPPERPDVESIEEDAQPYLKRAKVEELTAWIHHIEGETESLANFALVNELAGAAAMAYQENLSGAAFAGRDPVWLSVAEAVVKAYEANARAMDRWIGPLSI